jgi:DNA modification methylase
VEAVVTDPPYAIYGSSTGVSSSVTDDKIVRPFFRSVLLRAEAILRLFGPAFVFCDWRSYPSWWWEAANTHLDVKNLVVWSKNGSGLGNNFANTHELITYCVKMPPQGAMKSGRKTTGIREILSPNVITFDRARGDDREHNAAKPVGLLVRLIEVSTDAGAVVVDLFGGSGSTLIACAESGRRAGLVELEPGWCDVIRRRWTRWAVANGVDPGPGALQAAP